MNKEELKERLKIPKAERMCSLASVICPICGDGLLGSFLSTVTLNSGKHIAHAECVKSLNEIMLENNSPVIDL